MLCHVTFSGNLLLTVCAQLVLVAGVVDATAGVTGICKPVFGYVTRQMGIILNVTSH